jgi:hypothetical protein
MSNGHPWFTDELFELRAAQRRTMRFIPDDLVHDAQRWITSLPESIAGEDRGLLEATLRDMATGSMMAMAAVLADVTAWGRRTAETSALAAVGPWVLDLYDDTTRESPAPEFADLVEHDHICQIVAILALADQLAGDYVDPRLELQLV